jgi:hydrogenase expression/formation protein HypE
MAHGGGGRKSQRLIERVFLEAFRNPVLEPLGDGAVLRPGAERLAFSTDSFVVRPLFFPGGDIGSLAVHGTVNDLAMCGARPVALSAGFILEEGLPTEDLVRIAESMRRAADEAGVSIVTGDTKVVERGKGDGIFVNTAGLGAIPDGIDVGAHRIAPGDRLLVNGTIADHGVAILSVREGLEFETTIESDSASLAGLVGALLEAVGDGVHAMRDPTRGGVASSLNELAAAAGVGFVLEERALPVREEVRGACEIFGLDPLYVANEGKCLIVVDDARAEAALEVLRSHPLGRDAVEIGRAVENPAHEVVLRSTIRGSRIVDMLSGEQLPRIC